MILEVRGRVTSLVGCLFASLISLALLTGCGDVYDKDLVKTGKLTPDEAESIVKALPDKDASLFKQWYERSLSGERFSGEPTAFKVRDAITNQNEFLARQAEIQRQLAEIEREKNRKIELEQAELKRQLVEARIQAERLRRVDQEIRKHLSVEAKSFQRDTIFDQYGYSVGSRWILNLVLKNLSPTKEIIGVSGKILITDAFGNTIGTYPARIEPNVPPRESIEFRIAIKHNDRDPGMAMMARAETIFTQWQMDSLAYRDGSRIDVSSYMEIEAHFRRIFQHHPDASDVIKSTSFADWLLRNQQFKEVYDSGTAEQVVEMLNSFKKAHPGNKSGGAV